MMEWRMDQTTARVGMLCIFNFYQIRSNFTSSRSRHLVRRVCTLLCYQLCPYRKTLSALLVPQGVLSFPFKYSKFLLEIINCSFLIWFTELLQFSPSLSSSIWSYSLFLDDFISLEKRLLCSREIRWFNYL